MELQIKIRRHSDKSPSATGNADVPSSQPSEYDLKIDEQTQHFLSARQQLTYFLVTVAVVPIGFAMTMVNERNLDMPPTGWALLGVGIAAGVLAAGSALFSIYFEHMSHGLHIASRYKKGSYTDRPPDVQKQWSKFNDKATWLRRATLFLLATEMPVVAVFLAIFVIGSDSGG